MASAKHAPYTIIASPVPRRRMSSSIAWSLKNSPDINAADTATVVVIDGNKLDAAKATELSHLSLDALPA